jgi:hypothetical protein
LEECQYEASHPDLLYSSGRFRISPCDAAAYVEIVAL